MRLKLWITAIICLLLSTEALCAADWDIKADTWVSTDALGRHSLSYGDCPSTRSDRYVGMFYFLWQGQHGSNYLYDITNLLAANPTNPAYGPVGSFHWWGQPESGYFISTDTWVIRRNITMLADAGVDVVIFDVTNAFLYTNACMAFCQVAEDMKSNGLTVPQIAFITKTKSADVVQNLYDSFYSQNLYSDLWFQWQGKPIIFGDKDSACTDGNYLSDDVKNFFTWRKSWAWDSGQDKWQWLDTYPQDYSWDTNSSIPEEIPVGVASHATNNMGRSCYNNVEPAIDKYGLCSTTSQGICFAQQWERALSVDPEFVWVTGWNEWVAQRFISTGSDGITMLGKALNSGDSYFVDEYNQEFSRDIEPMSGGHTDDYYYQLVNYVRRYKGVRTPENPSVQKTIDINGDFSEWDDVGPEYRDTIGDTAIRNSSGWAGITYTNYTGRNDIVKCKAARDSSNIYFEVETKSALTIYSGNNWMLLFIDADLNPFTGWNGYDYVINLGGLTANTTTVKKNLNNSWSWQTIDNVPYKVNGNKLEISVPRFDLGYGTAVDPAFDFHWADNPSIDTGDITAFSVSGDSAPNRRANYRYSSYVPGPTWEFNSDNDLLSWSTTYNMSNVAISNDCLTGDVSGSGGYVLSQRYPSIDANSNHYIQIRMKCDSGTYAEFFWGTASQPYCVSTRLKLFKINSDGQFHDYCIDMSANTQWTGWVNSLRLNPTNAKTCHFEVDYIRVRNTPPDTTAPTTPSAPIAAGAFSASSAVTFNWDSSTDADTGIAGYNCQIGTSADGADVYSGFVPCSTSITITGSAPNIYYCRVQAVDGAGNCSGWSESSNGIMVVDYPNVTSADAKALPDSSTVGLANQVVTAVFDGCFYIENPNRFSGIKVVPMVMPVGLSVGSIVNVAGTINKNSAGEREMDSCQISQ